jgi:RNA polymerase sigma-70 factor (ECF subfamily)
MAGDSKLTRASLLSRVRDPADDAAWREFEATYRDLIVSYCRARGLQQADAEDICQQVMLRLSGTLRGFRYEPGKGRFRHYLGRAVRNTIIEKLARPKGPPRRIDSGVLAALPADPAEDEDEIWEREWTDYHYRRALATIEATFDKRSVVVFERLLAGESIDGIAQEYDMSTQAVHKVKQRIRNRMQALILQQIRDEDEPA